MNSNVVPHDSCGNPLYFQGFVCPPDQPMCCSARFAANPDASGLGIVISFAANGAINMIIATFLWYLKNFTRKPGSSRDFEIWVQNLADLLAQASLFPGITLLVAAFSQHQTITIYHFYISTVLADLTTSGRVVCLVNVLISHSRVTKIQATLAAIFQFLFLASLGVLIYRLSADWSNSPGKCFALYDGGFRSLQERDFIRFWVLLQLSIWFYWHLVCPVQVLVFRDWLAKVPRTVRFWFSFVFYVILDLFLWIWQLYLIAKTMVENRQRIIGNEWAMSFGQVAALMAVATLCYAMFLSYQDYRLKQKAKHLPEDSRKDMEAAFMAL